MGTPYVGEVRIFAGNFPPDGWAFCDGQLLAISSYEELYALIGTTYGGDGVSTFGLPDLRGRLPLHNSAQFVLGSAGGSETVTLATGQLPVHQHPPSAVSGSGGSASPKSARWAATSASVYGAGSANATLNGVAVSPAGGGQPHENLSPFLVLSFIIALAGVFPSAS